MLLRDSKSASFLACPAIAAVTLFLLRNRQITSGSPGSGVTIAATELLVRASVIFHAAVSIGTQGFSLLLRVATAPMAFAFAGMEAERHLALAATSGIGSVLQHALLYVMQTF